MFQFNPVAAKIMAFVANNTLLIFVLMITVNLQAPDYVS